MIFHKKFGPENKKIVIGIHGWGGTHNTFLPIEKSLRGEFMMINFDLPGYGQSSKPSNWEICEIIDSLADEITKLYASLSGNNASCCHPNLGRLVLYAYSGRSV